MIACQYLGILRYISFYFQKLQDRLKQLLAGQNDTTKKLNQSLELIDKLQTDVRKKTEQIEKFQRDSSYKDDRIRNLEIRGIDWNMSLVKRENLSLG